MADLPHKFRLHDPRHSLQEILGAKVKISHNSLILRFVRKLLNMSVTLSLRLEVLGTQNHVNDFWNTLNPQNEPLRDDHFHQFSLDYEPIAFYPINDFDVQKSKNGELIIISWDGGFGSFDKGFMGLTFRDAGVAFSELFPELEFTLYYDGHGAEFAGGYSYEKYSENSEVFFEVVYAGGVRYRAGVRIGEKVLIAEEYFTFSPDETEDTEIWEPDEIDYENNRNKIDVALENSELRKSTLFYRDKWEKSAIDNDSAYFFDREFWKEVPLINTQKIYLNFKVTEAALAQSKHSIAFIPKELATNKWSALTSNSNALLKFFSLDTDSQKNELQKLGLILYLAIATSILISNPINKLIEDNPSCYEGADKEVLSEAWLRSRISALDIYDKNMKDMLDDLAMKIGSSDIDDFKNILISCIRILCSPKYD